MEQTEGMFPKDVMVWCQCGYEKFSPIPRTCRSSKQTKLENVAIINEVLPLKATRWYAIANIKCFLGPEIPATSFHLHLLCGATLFGSHQQHLLPSILQSLVGFRLLTSMSNAGQQSRT